MEGPRGSFGGPGGSGRSWGGSGGVQGRFWRVMRGPLEKVIFSFLGGEFVNGLMKYWCFQFCVVLWSGRRSLDYATFYRFSKHILLRNSEVNMLWKRLFFEHIQYGIFRFQWKNDAENMISGGDSWGPGRSILMVILHFSIVLLWRLVRFLKDKLNMMLLQESEKVNKTLDVEQKVRFVWIIWWIQSAK